MFFLLVLGLASMLRDAGCENLNFSFSHLHSNVPFSIGKCRFGGCYSCVSSESPSPGVSIPVSSDSLPIVRMRRLLWSST